jgi:ABC-type branched-subunit amino acid transport system ATPase component
MAILFIDHVRCVMKLSPCVYVLSLGEISAQRPPAAFTGDLQEQLKSSLGINF